MFGETLGMQTRTREKVTLDSTYGRENFKMDIYGKPDADKGNRTKLKPISFRRNHVQTI